MTAIEDVMWTECPDCQSVVDFNGMRRCDCACGQLLCTTCIAAHVRFAELSEVESKLADLEIAVEGGFLRKNAELVSAVAEVRTVFGSVAAGRD